MKQKPSPESGAEIQWIHTRTPQTPKVSKKHAPARKLLREQDWQIGKARFRRSKDFGRAHKLQERCGATGTVGKWLALGEVSENRGLVTAQECRRRARAGPPPLLSHATPTVENALGTGSTRGAAGGLRHGKLPKVYRTL
ncbi:hypothetical protein AAFF_G00386010 [Aldrovandia affinis]|uniref:Uncharacterized protein n=1 Tax=Aldrovandia affinis TaxID=143900 RepID=A0AAD7WLR3_9TELE|nr:hypothetical protein AAFF_G00386010 [Aldrovandia affinis]